MIRSVFGVVALVAAQIGLVLPAAAQNSPPTADDFQWTMYAPCRTLQFDLTGYINDPDGDPLTVVSTTNGSQGTVWNEGPILIYQPGTAYYSTDSFTYTVADSSDAQATGTVTIYFDDMNC